MAKKRPKDEDGDEQYPSRLFSSDELPQLISQSQLILTPKKAKELLMLDVYRRQRGKKPALLAFLKDVVVQGLWHGSKIAIADLDFDYITADGTVVRKLLANGGHTCTVHATNNFTTDKNVLQHFRCPTPAALALLYSQFDRSESSRSVEDQCLAFIDIMPETDNWNKSSINKCSTAVAVSEYGFSYRSVTKVIDRVNLTKSTKYYKHAAFIRKMIFDTEGGITRNRWLAQGQAVLSVMLESHMISANDAQTFWDGVRTGAGLSVGSPQLTLNKFLLQSSHGGNSGSTLYITNVRCRQAWNAFRKGLKLPRFSGRIPPDFPPLV